MNNRGHHKTVTKTEHVERNGVGPCTIPCQTLNHNRHRQEMQLRAMKVQRRVQGPKFPATPRTHLLARLPLTYILTLTLAVAFTHAPTYKLANTHTHILTGSLVHPQPHRYAPTHTRTRIHAHTNTNTYTHTNTNTITQQQQTQIDQHDNESQKTMH